MTSPKEFFIFIFNIRKLDLEKAARTFLQQKLGELYFSSPNSGACTEDLTFLKGPPYGKYDIRLKLYHLVNTSFEITSIHI